MKKLLLSALVFVSIYAQAASVAVKPIVNGPTCFGGSNGSIDLVITGGLAPYSFTWDNALPPTQSQSNLAAGTYTVTVKDANNVAAVSAITIAEPAKIVISAFVNNVSNGQNNGAILLNVQGGTPGFSYLWSNGSSSDVNNNLGVGSYSVTVTDAWGCTASTTKTVSQQVSMSLLNNVYYNKTDGQSSVAGIEEAKGLEVSVYPNPATEYFAVKLSNATEAHISLFNIIGQNVIETKATAAETKLDVSNLPKGNYVLSVKAANENFNKVVVVK